MKSREQTITRTLLVWHRSNKKTFPWRVNPNPYRVLVAEFFLQRTPADRVAKFYPSFITRFPTPEKLASADLTQLEQISRPMGLKKRLPWIVSAVKTICQKYGGKVPNNRDELMQLPGVGSYTASAILCFGFRRDIPIVDTNVVRVLTRIFDLPKSCGVNNEDIKKISQKLVPKGRAATYHEALLDFALMVCKKRPLCDVCPLVHLCKYPLKMLSDKQ